MALGATRRDLVRLVVRRAATVAAGGTAAGIVLSLAADRIWRSIVYGSDAPDPVLVTTLALGFALLALLASVLPATRAAGVDPAEALRAE